MIDDPRTPPFEGPSPIALPCVGKGRGRLRGHVETRAMGTVGEGLTTVSFGKCLAVVGLGEGLTT